MKHKRVISLSAVAQSHAAEVDAILAGIQGKPSSVLWTSQIRANVRGGKCPIITVSAPESNGASTRLADKAL
jgi:hypothetical protein